MVIGSLRCMVLATAVSTRTFIGLINMYHNYIIAGKFSRVFNLAVWRSRKKTPN